MKSLSEKRDELANLEASYFSNIQFPPTWVETGVKELKQDVNAARRIRCHDDHKWGFQKGFDSALAEVMPQVHRLVEALEKRYTNSVSPSGTANDAEIDSLIAEWRKFKGEG